MRKNNKLKMNAMPSAVPFEIILWVWSVSISDSFLDLLLKQNNLLFMMPISVLSNLHMQHKRVFPTIRTWNKSIRQTLYKDTLKTTYKVSIKETECVFCSLFSLSPSLSPLRVCVHMHILVCACVSLRYTCKRMCMHMEAKSWNWFSYATLL